MNDIQKIIFTIISIFMMYGYISNHEENKCYLRNKENCQIDKNLEKGLIRRSIDLEFEIIKIYDRLKEIERTINK